MSNTFRRLNVGTSLAENFTMDPNKIFFEDGVAYQVWPSGYVGLVYRTRGGQSPEEIADRHNFRFFTDNLDGFSPPKWFRQSINRSERRQVKLNLHEALVAGDEDEFVDFRAKMPYWD